VRVILADDAVVIRHGLARLLADEGITITAEVGDAQELLAAVEEDAPDAVVVDIRMPPSFSSEGLYAAQTIRAKYPGVAVLVLSQHVDAAYAMRLLEERSGRVGYLLKDRIADVGEFLTALRRVAEGGTALDPEAVAQLLLRKRSAPLARLSPRETEVLRYMAEGRSNAGVADLLMVSESAVAKHVNSIFTKLDLPMADSDHRRVLAVLTFLKG